MTTLTRNGTAEVQNGQRYINTLCKHWARKFDIQLTDEGARIVFPKEDDDPDYSQDAIAILRATESRIEAHLTAHTQVQLDVYWGVIEDHLDRFASREGGLRLLWGNI
ncbi:MAG: DUF2218 domain-containing protein [Luteolibacter sp.]